MGGDVMSAQIIVLSEYRAQHSRVEMRTEFAPLSVMLVAAAVWVAWVAFWFGGRA